MTRMLVFALCCLLPGCSTRDPAEASEVAGMERSQAGGAREMVQSLEKAGLRLEPAGEIEQPFWTRRAQVYAVDGGDLQLYEFADAAAAQNASREVAPGGGSIGTTSMSWIAPPHFFRRGRVIAIYLGSDPSVLATLRQVMGPAFAERG